MDRSRATPLTVKPAAGVALALVAAILLGWVWGASGRTEREMARVAEAQRADLTEARALALEGQLAVAGADWAGARRAFDAARAAVERVQDRLRESALAERAGRLEIVVAHLREAADLAAAAEPGATAAAEEAVAILRRTSI